MLLRILEFRNIQPDLKRFNFNAFLFYVCLGPSSFARTLISWWNWSRLRTARTFTTPSSPATRASPIQTPSWPSKPSEQPPLPRGKKSADLPISFSKSDSQLADPRPVQPGVRLPRVDLSETWETDSPSSSRQHFVSLLIVHQSEILSNLIYF